MQYRAYSQFRNYTRAYQSRDEYYYNYGRIGGMLEP